MPSSKRLRVVAILVAGVVALLVLETGVLAATLTRKAGAVTAVQAISATDHQYAYTNVYSTIPGMSMQVVVPPGEQAMFLITFSAESRCLYATNNYCYIRARVDSIAASPGEVIFDSVDDGNSPYTQESNSMQFFFGPVGPGPHMVDIRYRVGSSGTQEFDVDARTLTVLRAKI